MTATTPFASAPVRKDRVSAAAPAVEQAAPVGDQPNYRAIYTSTIFAVSMLFLIGVGLPTAMIYGNATGWGLGLMTAFWGGPSFGVMAGSARVSAWEEKHGSH